ncbi:hypothetical protein B566_EDAN009158 [Ephemera danica]|nr:hypothetical protein B566_EDAN018227 [Ephemera danica]KAF4529982.1 hypothetical protein B566_EDAN009158 [Ephemera danica]
MRLLVCSVVLLLVLACAEAFPYVQLVEVDPEVFERQVRSADPQYHRPSHHGGGHGYRPGHGGGGGYRPNYGGGGGYRPGGGGFSGSASNAAASSQSFNAGGFGGGFSGSASNAAASSQSFGG